MHFFEARSPFFFIVYIFVKVHPLKGTEGVYQVDYLTGAAVNSRLTGKRLHLEERMKLQLG